MMTAIDRSKCRWRGLDVSRVEDAMKTGEPHFAMPPTNAKCPVCGRRFRTKPSDAHECCSLSCGAKMKWRRRRA